MIVEALLSVIDRLIAIVNGRIAGRKEMFDRLLEPIFTDLLAVHGDYIAMFEDAQVIAKTPALRDFELQTSLLQAKGKIRARRREFEPIRRKVQALASELKARELPAPEEAFVRAVIAYLPSGEPSLPQSSATTLLAYLDDAAPEDIDLLIARTVQKHRNAWSILCEAYARVKVAVAEVR